MEREKPREPPQAGDIRLDPFEVLRSEQPLSGEEKALLRRGYDLFEFYRRHLLEEHGEMRRARALRPEETAGQKPHVARLQYAGQLHRQRGSRSD